MSQLCKCKNFEGVKSKFLIAPPRAGNWKKQTRKNRRGKNRKSKQSSTKLKKKKKRQKER